jgi:hypothetical protein
MSVRNATVLLLALSTLLFLAACGSSGSSPATPVAPPSGNFSNSNLNGTYVFSVSGTDSNGVPYAMAGTFTANGSGGNNVGGITGGTLDINDPDTSEFSAPVVGASINSNSTYSVGIDGRGQAVIGTSIGNGFPTLTFDFVLSSSSHGLITEFDSFGSASGTLDLQASGVTPSGSYAYSFSGATSSSGAAFATVGNFTLGSGGSITGLADFNNGALTISQQETLGGTVAVSSPPSTVLSTSQYPSLAFDVFPIDAAHLKFIEVDANGTLSGDAFSQTSTSIPVGTMAFTLAGTTSGNAPVAAGGFMVTDNTGDLTNASTEDYNVGGTLSPSTPVPFTGSYAAGAGRYTLSNFTSFIPAGLTFAAYPSSGGLLFLEIDNLGVTTGAAYTQTAGATLAVPQGYGMNLAGDNLSNSVEVDDIAEFTTATGGTLSSGIMDENYAPSGIQTLGIALSSGTYTALDSQGRYGISATASNSKTSTLLGGFDVIAYTVDGTTFPFMEYDAGQVATGVIVLQSPSSSSPALAHPQTVMVRTLVHPHVAHQKKN